MGIFLIKIKGTKDNLMKTLEALADAERKLAQKMPQLFRQTTSAADREQRDRISAQVSAALPSA